MRTPARPLHHTDTTANVRPSGATNDRQAFAPSAVRDVIAVACRAPSLHNTQPWQWRLRDDRLELRADRTRQLRVADPDAHSLLVSCGAALVLTDLALRARGWMTRIERLPDPGDPDLVATFDNSLPHRPTETDHALLATAERRSSDRRPFQDRPVPDMLIEAMRRAAGDSGVHAHFPARADESLNLAVAVSWADRVERRDADYLAEMARWLHDPDVHASRNAVDGVPATAIPHVTDGHPRHTDIPLRDFEIGVSGREQIEADVDERPLIAVLLTDSDSAHEHLASGEAMMRVMLEAGRVGLACCPLSQAVDLVAFRSRVQTLMGWTSYPQMMLRIGYPPPDQPTRARSPRRPVDDQLDIVQGPAH